MKLRLVSALCHVEGVDTQRELHPQRKDESCCEQMADSSEIVASILTRQTLKIRKTWKSIPRGRPLGPRTAGKHLADRRGQEKRGEARENPHPTCGAAFFVHAELCMHEICM